MQACASGTFKIFGYRISQAFAKGKGPKVLIGKYFYRFFFVCGKAVRRRKANADCFQSELNVLILYMDFLMGFSSFRSSWPSFWLMDFGRWNSPSTTTSSSLQLDRTVSWIEKRFADTSKLQFQFKPQLHACTFKDLHIPLINFRSSSFFRPTIPLMYPDTRLASWRCWRFWSAPKMEDRFWRQKFGRRSTPLTNLSRRNLLSLEEKGISGLDRLQLLQEEFLFECCRVEFEISKSSS